MAGRTSGSQPERVTSWSPTGPSTSQTPTAAGATGAADAPTGAAAAGGARSWNPTGSATGSATSTGSATPTGAADRTNAAAPAEGEDSAPDWRSLLKAMAPPPGPDQEPMETGSIPVVDADATSEDGENAEVPERIRRPLPFTWLQWIILVVVFFVLGFLIVLVGKTATGAEGDIAPTLALATELLPAPLT